MCALLRRIYTLAPQAAGDSPLYSHCTSLASKEETPRKTLDLKIPKARIVARPWLSCTFSYTKPHHTSISPHGLFSVYRNGGRRCPLHTVGDRPVAIPAAPTCATRRQGESSYRHQASRGHIRRWHLFRHWTRHPNRSVFQRSGELTFLVPFCHHSDQDVHTSLLIRKDIDLLHHVHDSMISILPPGCPQVRM